MNGGLDLRTWHGHRNGTVGAGLDHVRLVLDPLGFLARSERFELPTLRSLAPPQQLGSIGLQLDDLAVAKLSAVLDAILFVAGSAIILANVAERCLEGI